MSGILWRWSQVAVSAVLVAVMASCATTGSGESPRETGTDRRLTISPASIDFGNVLLSLTTEQSIMVRSSGSDSVTIDGVSVTGEGFSVSGVSFPQTLEGGESLTLTVRFSPSEDGKKSGNVSLPSNAAGSPARIALAGNGVSSSASGQLSVNPVAFDFGNVPTGNTETRDVVLSNSGGTALTVTQASVAGTNFTLSGLLLPLTLQVGQTATFQVSFTPDTSGAVTGSISLVSDAANSPTVMSLSGDGVVLIGTLAVNPWIIDFGDISAGTSTTQNVTLTSTGNADVTITESTLTGGPGFSASQLSLPLTLAAGQSI